MRKIIFLLPVLLLAGLLVNAQNLKITGKVTDENGLPVDGATVRIEGKQATGTATNAKGEFSISAKEGNSLVISAIGFLSGKVKVTSGQSSYTITLKASVNVMDEVIVTSGGIRVRRKELGTTSAVIKAESLTAGKSPSIAGGLQGKVAGLQINSTGGGVNPNYRLVLRGQRSLTGNNQALIVLDNVIVPNAMLGNLNPEDVEDIVILNGSGAAALYGSQASNGALIVTTKKGKKGITQVSLSHTVTMEKVAFYPKIQTKFGAGGSGYGVDPLGQPVFSYLENQSYGPAFDGTKRPLGPPLEDGSQDSTYYRFYNGHNKFWVNGIINQTDVSLTNGDDKSTFYLSGQFASQDGTTPHDHYNRAIVRINGTRKLGNGFNVTYSTSYTQNRYDITTQTGAMYGDMLNMPTNVDITRYKDWQHNKFANPNGFYNPWYLNPYFVLDNWRTNQRNDYLTANVEVKYNTPVKGLDLTVRQGIFTRNYSNKDKVGAFKYTDYAKHTDASSKTDIAASVSEGSNYTTELLSDAFAEYSKKVSDFNFKLIAGAQWKEDQAKFMGITANGLVVPGLFNVSNGVGTPAVSESDYTANNGGVYGDLRISYKGYLFLHGSGRNDWTSTLAKANRSFFYPAADISFIASDALNFLKNSRVVNYLKLRAGWSKVGQVNLPGSTFGAYALLPTVGVANGFPYGTLAGYTIGNGLVSNNLKPEITKGYEFGFDINLLKDMVEANVTWFHSQTNNQTVSTGVSSTTGFSSLLTNSGLTQSQGLEFTGHVTPIKKRDWTVTVGGNYTYLDNKVISITNDLPKLALATYGNGVGSYAVAGLTFPSIMGYDYKRDGAGHVIVDAVTGLPTQSDTISVLGNAVAKNKLSLDGSVRFKNFRLSFLFEYRGSYQVFNNLSSDLDWSGTGYRTAIYNRQRFVFPNSVIADPANPGKYIKNTNIEVANGNGNNGFWSDGINRSVTSNYVTSGDFWKLREISLAYDVPASVLNKTKFIKGLTISVQGRNLAVWMAKDNYYTDPEYSDAGNDSNGIGLTGYQTPPSKYFGATVSFKF